MFRFALFLIKRAKLDVEKRNQLASVALDKLNATPFKDVFTFREDGSLLINGNEIDMETARKLRESARGALNSSALRLVHESVTYQAFVQAAIEAKTDEDLLFGKSAIWFGQQEIKLLKLLAGEDEISLEI